MYYSISQAAFLLGVCTTTIRRWDKLGLIKCVRTPGNHRRIHKDEIARIIAGKKRRYRKKKRGMVLYARVSSHEQKQKGDLQRQLHRLRNNVRNKGNMKIVELCDVGSGLNTRRSGLKRLFRLVQKGKVSEIHVTYADRLTRFGFEYLQSYFGSYGVRIHSLNKKGEQSAQEEMVDDLIAIITSFSGKIHGMRSHKHSKSGS